MIKEKDVKLLKSQQEDLRLFELELSKKREEFDALNMALINRIGVLKNKQEDIKATLWDQAEREFEETKQKKLLGGIGIRVLTKLNYEEGEAMIWAGLNMPVAIKKVLDKKQFESFAKTNELDFVKKEEKVSVTFPSEIII